MRKNNYTILVGSFARETNNKNSDLDIVRINHNNSINHVFDVPKKIPVSYIDYDLKSFFELYNQGSLFLKHTFEEGKLLYGDKCQWKQLTDNFRVSIDFSETILEYRDVLKFIDKYPSYETAYIPYLSNIFRALKNIAIFKLAEAGIYEFDKSIALFKWFGLSNREINLLIMSNNAFERDCRLGNTMLDDLQSFALEWKQQHHKIYEKV